MATAGSGHLESSLPTKSPVPGISIHWTGVQSPAPESATWRGLGLHDCSLNRNIPHIPFSQFGWHATVQQSHKLDYPRIELCSRKWTKTNQRILPNSCKFLLLNSYPWLIEEPLGSWCSTHLRFPQVYFYCEIHYIYNVKILNRAPTKLPPRLRSGIFLGLQTSELLLDGTHPHSTRQDHSPQLWVTPHSFCL